MGYDLVCRACGRHTKQDVFRCPHCNGILDCRFDLEDPPRYRSILQGAKGFWDYRPFFPVAGERPVSLGEGNTPLVAAPRLASQLGMQGVYVKNEGMNPSGTFKDRCQSIAYTKAQEMAAPATIIGSAGNAGAAAAAYAAASGIPCFVVVPADTNMERLAQTLQYGANLIRVQGNVSDCIELLETVCKERGWQDMTTAHSHNPFQGEGTKTIAYELARDMEWDVPDWIIVPIGGGGILSSIYKGYQEMYTLGLIQRMPKMAGVQEAGCAAVAEAFEKGAAPQAIQRVQNPTGVAVAIKDAYPLDGETALQAIYDSGGVAARVTAGQIAQAQGELGRSCGVFAEPASAATVAALFKLREAGVVQKEDRAVCIITGNGLKDAGFALQQILQPPAIPMSQAALNAQIDQLLGN